jgi:hypothetical protein
MAQVIYWDVMYGSGHILGCYVWPRLYIRMLCMAQVIHLELRLS